MRALAIAGVLFLALGCSPAEPEPIAVTESALLWQPVTKLTRPNGELGDNFGAAIALDGSRIVVGSDYATADGVTSGSASVFVANGSAWTHEQELVPSDGEFGDQFGVSVAIQGDTVLVGASAAYPEHGAVYVFSRTGSTWTEAQIIPSPNAVNFGDRVALDGDVAVIGAINTDNVAPTAGLAYVYRRLNGTFAYEQTLKPETPSGYMEFGFAVSISGNTIAVSAPSQPNGSVFDAGMVHVFESKGGSWSTPTALGPSDPLMHGAFGSDVQLSGDMLVVGSEEANGGATESGAAYVFRRTNGVWTEEDKLVASDGALGDQLGTSVTISGNVVLAGGWGADANSGAAYSFGPQGASWAQTEELAPSAGMSGGFFGVDVALNGSILAVGAFKEQNGVVYVFSSTLEPNGTPCTGGTACQSGICVDGVCCESECTDTCSACSAAKKGAGVDGACEPIVANSDPEDECEPESEASCGRTGQCDGAGNCALRSAGSACGTTSCSSGFVTGRLCDGAGACVDDTKPCAPWACSEDACATSCTTENECAPGAGCDLGQCVGFANCDGDHTVTKPNGDVVDCSPYECDPQGGCRVVCDSIDQCTPGHVCSASYRCVSQADSGDEDDSGCGCRALGSSTRPGPAALAAFLAAFGLFLARRRRM